MQSQWCLRQLGDFRVFSKFCWTKNSFGKCLGSGVKCWWIQGDGCGWLHTSLQLWGVDFLPSCFGEENVKVRRKTYSSLWQGINIKTSVDFFFFLISFASWLYSGLGRNCSGNASLGKHREKVKCGLLCAVLLVICTALLLHHSPGSAWCPGLGCSWEFKGQQYWKGMNPSPCSKVWLSWHRHGVGDFLQILKYSFPSFKVKYFFQKNLHLPFLACNQAWFVDNQIKFSVQSVSAMC